MPIFIKPVAVLADKFASRAAAASQDFANGVAGTQKDQAGLAIAQKNTWIASLNAAAQADRFAKGLEAAGTAKWKAAVAAKGAARYPTGVQGAKSTWAAKVSPYLDVLSNLNLPPRLPKGDPGNNARTVTVNQALHAKKLSS